MRKLELNRDEGELLVDLLAASDSHLAEGLEDAIRELFGMVSREREAQALAD